MDVVRQPDPIVVLSIDNEASSPRNLDRHLNRFGCIVVQLSAMTAEALQSLVFDVVLVHLGPSKGPGSSGDRMMRLVERLRLRFGRSPVLVVNPHYRLTPAERTILQGAGAIVHAPTKAHARLVCEIRIRLGQKR